MDTPPWLKKAKKRYKQNTSNILLQTDISRGTNNIYALEDLTKINFFQTKNYNLLLIGAGQHSRSGEKGIQILCPYEIYNIAAYLESRGWDYKITVVDIDPEPLRDIEKRERIFVPHAFIQDTEEEYDSRMNWRKTAWKEYLAMTNQQDAMTYEKMEGLKTHPCESIDILLDKGVHHANIPQSFAQKLAKGDIELINEDIALVGFSEKFDYISCSNVLYMLSKEGQQLAIYNMVNALKKPGAIFLWEPLQTSNNGRKITPIIENEKGWLTENTQRDLGIKAYELYNPSPRSQMGIICNVNI